MKRPLVSVIIPVFNQEPYLCQCLDSVVRQTLRDIEVIAINDGSTDKSPNILSEYAANDNRIIIINQQNQGVAQARNNGLDNASGEFVAFMDPDDWYPDNDVLEVMYNTAISQNVKIVGGSLIQWKNGKAVFVHDSFEKVNIDYNFPEDKLVYYYDYQFDYGYWRFLYKLEMLRTNKIRFPKYSRFQDPPFFCSAMICAEKFYALKRVTYVYRNKNGPVIWTDQKLLDIIHGLTDLFELSNTYNLAKLHFIAFYRLNGDWLCDIIRENMRAGNRLMLVQLAHANEKISPELLWSAESLIDRESWGVMDNFSKTDFVFIRALLSAPYKEELQQLSKQLYKLQNSYSYRIGRAITWLPRKVRDGIRIIRYSKD